jgi:hypothetical protein
LLGKRSHVAENQLHRLDTSLHGRALRVVGCLLTPSKAHMSGRLAGREHRRRADRTRAA